MAGNALPRGTVVVKGPGRTDALFPTVAENIDWKKSNVVVIQRPAPPAPPPSFVQRIVRIFKGKGK